MNDHVARIRTETKGFRGDGERRMAMTSDGSHSESVPAMIALNVSNDRFGVGHFFFDEAPFRAHLLFVGIALRQCPLSFDDIEDRLDVVHSFSCPFQFHRSSTLSFDGSEMIRLRNVL